MSMSFNLIFCIDAEAQVLVFIGDAFENNALLVGQICDFEGFGELLVL